MSTASCAVRLRTVRASSIGRRNLPVTRGGEKLVPDEGIEPPTFGLQNRCSTAELIRLPTRRGNTSRVHSSQDGLITARNVYQCPVPVNLCAVVRR